MTTEPNNKNFERAIHNSLAPADMSDADIERLLNDVTAKPMSDATVARILKQVNPAHPSDRTVRLPRGLHEPGDRPGSSKEIAMSLSNPNRPAATGGINRGSVAALVVSAMCLLGVLIITARPRVPGEITNDPPPIAHEIRDAFKSDAIVPQVASAVTQVAKATIGDLIQTRERERRRLSLPDGSVLFMNENTTAKVEDLRLLKVTSGEVFVEVCPKFDDENKREFFYVETPNRKVTAIGTKFAVRAADENTDVLVTQGKVKIDGVEDVVSAGRYVRLNKEDVQTAVAPRASEALSWTEDLMVAAPIVPRSKYCGGALISVDPNGQETRLSMRNYHVDVHIEDGFARTTIDQTYFNHTHSRLEGQFKFPLPADASLSRLAMYVGPKLMEGGMAERQHARNTFEQIVHRKKDPALLEWIDGTTFSMRVFPLEARQEKRLIISYTQRLNTAYGKTQYRFPAGHNLDVVRDWSTTVRVKDGEKLTWKSPSHAMKAEQAKGDLVLKSSMKNALFDTDVVLEIQDDWAHSTEPKAVASGLRAKDGVSQSERDGSDVSESSPATKVASTDDLAKAPKPEASAYGSVGATGSRLTRTVHEDHQYLMLRHRPELKAEAKKRNRDWVFLFETSGDRNPILARAQIEVIRTLLTNAEHEDTFNIVTAGTRPKTFKESEVACEAKNINAAIAWLETSHLIGALDFEQGLKASVKLLEPKALASGLRARDGSMKNERGGSRIVERDSAPTVGSHDENAKAPKPGASAHGSQESRRERFLIHVGSGLPVLGQTSEKELVANIPRSIRYVGVGVGKRWSRQFMKMAASRTGGYFTQINPDEKVNWRAFELLSVLNAPRLMNVSVIDETEKLSFLTYTESIAHGDEICAIARLPKDAELPKSLIVTGELNGKTWKDSVPVEDVADKADYLPRSWARMEIDRLIADGAAKHRSDIIKLSKAMYVMSPFTSLLVLENDAMYTQYKIDRGRKDHWALYPAPDTIKVVHEPMQRGLAQQKAKPKSVLDTVLARNRNPVFGSAHFEDLIERYDELMDAKRYAEAIVLAKQAKELRPALPESIVMLEKAKFARQITINNAIRAKRSEDALLVLNSVDASLIPSSQEIDYPENWSEIVREGRLSRGRREFNSFFTDVGRDYGGPAREFQALSWRRRTDQPSSRININTIRNPEVLEFLFGDVDGLFDPRDRVRPSRDDVSRTVVGLQSPDKFVEEFGLAADFSDAQLGYRARTFAPSRGYRRGSEAKVPLERYSKVPVLDALSGEAAPIFTVDPPGYFEGYALPALTGSGRALSRWDDTVASDGLELLFLDSTGSLNRARRNRSGRFEHLPAFEAKGKVIRELSTGMQDPFTPQLRRMMRLSRQELGENVRQHGESISASDFTINRYRTQLDVIPQQVFAIDGEGRRGGQAVPSDAYFGNQVLFSTTGNGNARFVRPQVKFGGRLNSVPDVSLSIATQDPSDGGFYYRPLRRRSQSSQLYAHLYDDLDELVQFKLIPESRFLSDLIAHAPGMNSTRADLLAIVEAESDRKPKRGRIDEAARTLINKARGLGWETVTVGKDDNPVQIHCNGAGQFAWTRTVSEDLGEQVLCDGEHLWHLYGELGLGAKRDYSRFHRGMIANVAPWLVAPVAELSIGADVIAVDDRTVAIVPLGQHANEPKALASGLRASGGSIENERDGSETLEDDPAADVISNDENAKAPKPEASAYGSPGIVRIELVFAKNGRLRERRVVRVQGDATETLVRVTFGRKGKITVFNADGKQLAKFERPRTGNAKPFGGLDVGSAVRTNAAVNPTDDDSRSAQRTLLRVERKDLVILPLPYRDADTILARPGTAPSELENGDGDYSSLSEENALALLATDAIQGNRKRLADVVMTRFFKQGDTRAGLYVLIANANPKRTVKAAKDGQPAVRKPLLNYQPNNKVSKPHKALIRFARHLATASTDNEFDASELLPADEPKALASGLRASDRSINNERDGSPTSKVESAAEANPNDENARVPKPEASAFGSIGSGRFLFNICRARNVYYRWHKKRAIGPLKKAGVAKEVDIAVDVVGSLRSPMIGWTILRTMQPYLDHSEFYAKFADAAKRYENAPHIAWFVRHERARTLFKAKKPDEASKLYAELLTSTLKAGFNPGIDKELREQFIKHRGQRNWTEMCRQTSETLFESNLLRTAITLSKQLRDLGDIDTANAIFEKAIAKLEPRERPDVAVLALQQYRLLKDNEEADKILAGMLENPWVATSAKLWRYGASLAEERGKPAEALRRLERAMTIEYVLRPDVINLQDTRQRYTALLQEYEKIVDASATLEQEPPEDLATRIVRAADQWRSMEDNDTQVCQLASQILTKLGKSELAWDYATTPLGTQPGSASWRSLGQHLSQLKQIQKASDAYDRAFEFEQTNPEILWEHVNLLRGNGRESEANPLLKRIAESNWQPRFNNVKANAKNLWISIGRPPTSPGGSDPVGDTGGDDPF